MEKLSKLVVRLADRTEKGLIAWQPTAEDEMFQFSLPDSSILIEATDIGKYYISILNGNGQVVERVSDETLDNQMFGQHYERMKRIYELARRKALKADETVDGILAELGD